MAENVSIDALHCFLIFLKNEGNQGRTGRALGISQARVSQRLKALKENYGELFVRGTEGVRLTPAGKLVQSSAEIITAEIRLTERRIEMLQSRKAKAERLHVAYSPSHMPVVARAIAKLRKDRPGLVVTAEEATPAAVVDSLRSVNGPDIGVGYITQDARKGLASLRLWNKPLALFANRDQFPSLANARPINAADLKDVPLALLQKRTPVRTAVDEYLRDKLRPRVIVESNTISILFETLRLGQAALILPSWYRDAPDFFVRPLAPEKRIPSFLLWNENRTHGEPAQAFIARMRNAVEGFPSSA